MILLGGQNFQGRTKNFRIIAENFYPRIKILGGKFFLHRPIFRRLFLWGIVKNFCSK